jgi:nucleotide-binding universal stress UspA family protein
LYKKILAPYDTSQFSERAAGQAVALAKMSGARLVFINVTTLPSLIYTYHEPTNSAINEAARLILQSSEDSATKALQELVARAKGQGVEASYVHAIGDPAEVIIEAAKSQKADLIVMGSRGLRGVARIKALGSVTRRVVEHADCPVLVVH